MSGSPEVFDPYLHWLGIDAAARPVNHYSLLGLPFFEADPAKISAAADERMRHIRQFQAGPRGAFTQKILNELARAKICLLNPVSKPAYDQALHQLLYPPPVTPSATAAPPPPRRRLEDIMPPGWDGSSLPMHAAVPLPPVYSPPSAYGQQQPAYSPQPAATELPESSQPKNTQSIAMVAGLGGAIVLIGVLGVLLIMRMMYPSATDIDLKTGTSSTAEVEQPSPAVAPMPAPVEEPPAEAIVVLQEGSGELNLTPATALVEGGLVREVVGTGEVLAKWTSASDIAEWQFKLVKPGFFELELQYLSHASLAGKLVKIEWGSDSKTVRLRSNESGELVRDSHIIVIKRGGQHTLTLRPTEALPADTFQLMSVRLLPATGP
jgi:hypothetical protein